MRFRILTPRLHALLDYGAALALIVLPFVLRLQDTGALALWLSVGGGVGLIAYSLVTDYPLGLASVLPFKVHLLFDLAAAAVFIVVPIALGWRGLAAGYYFVMAAAVILVVASSTTEEPAPVLGASRG